MASALAGSARTTSRVPEGSELMRSRRRWRRRRFTRFRTTAEPTWRDTAKPTSAGGASGFVGLPGPLTSSAASTDVDAATGAAARWTTRWVVPARRPRRIAIRKSSDSRMRCTPLSTGVRYSSGRNLGAALTATRRENGTACARAHPQSETVHLGPAPIVRLKSPLGHGDSLVDRSARLSPAAPVVRRIRPRAGALERGAGSHSASGQRPRTRGA